MPWHPDRPCSPIIEQQSANSTSVLVAIAPAKEQVAQKRHVPIERVEVLCAFHPTTLDEFLEAQPLCGG
jgi:hypothetical protein